MNHILFNKVSLIGLGLIGGSLAKTIKLNSISQTIEAYSPNQQEIDEALQQEIIDNSIKSIDKICSSSDLIVICAPLGAYEDILDKIKLNQNTKTTITDVGSVKSCVYDFISRSKNSNMLFDNFVLSHPIAGLEGSGFSSSVNNLFTNKKVIVCNNKTNSNYHLSKVINFWQLCGSKVEKMPSKKHDEIYSKLSHLPQFISFKYLDFLGHHYHEFSDKKSTAFSRFMRISYSNKELWKEIFHYNTTEISNSIIEFKKELNGIISSEEFIEELTLNITKQIKLRKNNYPNDELLLGHHNFKKKDDIIFKLILPTILSTILMNISKDLEYSGSGFFDFTSPLLYNIDDIVFNLNIYESLIQHFLELFIRDCL